MATIPPPDGPPADDRPDAGRASPDGDISTPRARGDTTTPRARGDTTAPRARGDLPATVGWVMIAAITLVVLSSWAPSLTAGLGDNHEGRILARHALNVQNAQADGLAASGWLSDWSPYTGGPDGGQASYAHHPPLMNLGYYLTAQVLPVSLDTAMRLFAYLTGAALLPLGAALLRRLGFRWVPVLLATVAVAITPLFWVYGRISGATTLLVAMALMIVRLREDRPVHPVELALAATICLAAIVAGYLGLATAALLGLALLAARGPDRATVIVGGAMSLGAAITLAYVLGGTGLDGVADQVQVRTQGGGFTTGEFIERLGRWMSALLPGWWRWLLLPAALAAGMIDRRSRAITLILVVVAVAYIVGLPNGSFIHDYWIFPILLPVWVGTAALAQAAGARSTAHPDVMLGAVGAAVVVVSVVGLLRADVPATYVTGPQAAGNLARASSPPPEQTAAWRTDGLPAPRWLSLYWDLPPAELARTDVDRVAPDDLVFIALDRAPAWLDVSTIEADAVATRGRYAVLSGRQLREFATAAG